MKIELIVLAAGNSLRYGKENKLFQNVTGMPMYRKLIERVNRAMNKFANHYTNVTDVSLSAVVVTQYPEIQQYAESLNFKCVMNSEPDIGISHSIKLALKESTDSDAAMIFLADHPYIHSDTILLLLRSYTRHPGRIVCPAHGEIIGTPGIYPADLYPELMALTGDLGCKKIREDHPDIIHLVEISDAKELLDIDTPENLN